MAPGKTGSNTHIGQITNSRMETGAGEGNPRLRVLATVSEDRVQFQFPASILGGSKALVSPALWEQKGSGLRGELLLCTNPYIKTHKHIESKIKI